MTMQQGLPGDRPRLRARQPGVMLAVGVSLGLVVGIVVGPARRGESVVAVDGAPIAQSSISPRARPTGTPGASELGTEGSGQAAAGGDTDAGTAGSAADPSEPSGGSTGAPGPGSGTPSAPSIEVMGVTDDTIRIGVGIPDLGVLAALGPDYDFGDPAEHMEALREDWVERGLVPIHGRNLEFFYRRYDIVGTEEMLAACHGWADNDKVFAVVAVQQFWAHAECLTEDKGIPMLTSVAYYDDTYLPRGQHLLFDLQTTIDRIYRNWVVWMDEQGLLEGRTIGLYRPTGRDGIPVTDSLIPELEKRGYEIAVHVTTDQPAYGSPQDTVAVQRFSRHVPPVDLALLIVSSINMTNFMQQADSQFYKPTYVVNDYFQATNDVAASTFPPSQFDGSLGMTSMRYGEQAAGLGETPRAMACVDNYAKRSGRRITYKDRPAEYLMLISGCDEGALLLRALDGAGRDLTVEGFASQLHQVRDMPMGIHSDVSFFRGVHGGGHNRRTIQWRASCTCYVAIDDWKPFALD